jgi:APA family basic amino acid/polyamine antiporter
MTKPKNKTLWGSLTRRKPIAKGLSQASSEKTLTWYDLTAYGIAATVGSGIYVTCGKVARSLAGPAVVISTGIAGLLSLFTGICYLEFASSMPISGSGYAYFYTAMGEFLGWFIGWNLTLEYAFAAAAIAGGWTQYLVNLMGSLGVKVPEVLYNIPIVEGSMFRINILAATVIVLIGLIVSRGIKFGSLFTNIITMVNVGIILFILGVGSFNMSSGVTNWTPFMPFGWKGVFQGSGDMFFSYIGYDTISSLAGDAINPGRDLPIAVLLTVGTASVLYMGVGLVLTGMQKYLLLDQSSPLATAFVQAGVPWAAYIVNVCAIFTMAATMFACLMGQPKIFQAIAKDGLLPKSFARENSAGTPLAGVFFTTLLTALLTMFLDVNEGLIEMISFGTLLGMSMLCAGLLVVRFEQHLPIKTAGIALTIIYFIGSIVTSLAYIFVPAAALYMLIITMGLPFLGLSYYFLKYGKDLASTSLAFACPLMPLLPCIAMAANSFMMLQMEHMQTSFYQFAVWTIIGLAIYFGYGITHSQLITDADSI